ncbi:pectinesterase inhibitor 3 [Diospyros lotus]|uniref:pectinesterase inhibitor 3 n=1 Tax=Diospyros lotus TaxID=55363 RepID=UPI0022581A5C|nr:pectinesterase inhibitor 3 [Diospyros lotus]
MATHHRLPPPCILLLLLLFLSHLIFAAVGKESRSSNKNDNLVRSSCVHASYPGICLRTLSSYKGAVNSPRQLAQAAVKVSLARAQKVSAYLGSLIVSSGGKKKREQAALRDCVEQVGDSVDQLRKTLSELKHLHRGGGAEFRWQMSNAETWVSAALTNEDTCLDGFREVEPEPEPAGGKKVVGSDVKRKITNVAKVTSNALYLINRLDPQTPI